jgi:hypothetical protein
MLVKTPYHQENKYIRKSHMDWGMPTALLRRRVHCRVAIAEKVHLCNLKKL